MGRKELRHHEAPPGRDWVISVKPLRQESTVSFVGERRGHDPSNRLDKLGVEFMCILIFSDPMFSAGSMMQNQTQWLTPGSMNSGRVPVSCSTSFCVSAKAHPDREIFRISLSIILVKCFCFPLWAYTATFVVSGNEAFGKHLEGWGTGCCQAAWPAWTSQDCRVALWVREQHWLGSPACTIPATPWPPVCDVCEAGEWLG